MSDRNYDVPTMGHITSIPCRLCESSWGHHDCTIHDLDICVEVQIETMNYLSPCVTFHNTSQISSIAMTRINSY